MTQTIQEKLMSIIGVGPRKKAIESVVVEAVRVIDQQASKIAGTEHLLSAARAEAMMPIPMRLRCPGCGALHVDEGEFAEKAHHTHACQECGEVWRPALQCTVGVRFLPGFKNEVKA